VRSQEERGAAHQYITLGNLSCHSEYKMSLDCG
jgi:hypothetical protein